MRKAAFALTVVFTLCFTVCNTTGYGRIAVGLNGMVYDFENKPVPQYIITIDNKTPVSTDINGRFFVPKVRSGKHQIRGEKSGYEEYKGEIIINDRRQIVYFRIPNTAQLLNLADDALSRNRIEEAALYIKRAETIGETTTELLFYSAVVFFRKGEYKPAIEKLKTALSLGSRDEYVTRFLDELIKRYGD
jgi:tetratricopeptide (TPR) repeat protein